MFPDMQLWLKIVLAVLGFILSGLLLWYLYSTKELLKRRSLWISTGAAALAICLLFSLILNFPSPNKYKQADPQEDTAYQVIAQI